MFKSERAKVMDEHGEDATRIGLEAVVLVAGVLDAAEEAGVCTSCLYISVLVSMGAKAVEIGALTLGDVTGVVPSIITDMEDGSDSPPVGEMIH